MRTHLTPLGQARVFRHRRTGELVVDTDSLRRASFSGGVFGDEDFEGDDDEGDDFGDDDEDFEGDDPDEDFEGDDDGDDGDFGEEFGRKRRRRRKSRKARERARKAQQRPAPSRRASPAPRPAPTEHWGMTAVGGTDAITANSGGAVSVKVRLQHDFRAQDITFTGSARSATVTSIFFGDRVVWSNSDGIDVEVFASTGFLRGLLKGQSLRAGLDITVNGALPGAGQFKVTLIGMKPVSPTC
jgi:hypothetical protein